MSDMKVPTMDIYGLSLAIQATWNVFLYKTSHSLEDVLVPGYFNQAATNSVRRLDRIEVAAGPDGEPEFATLVVCSVTTKGGGKSVEVSRLERR
ncbi:hypothetical protein [Bradyrhizobium sp. LA2.1]|uniref:hypothetical protein n=1 Tax=Bradyrhizobium sp. LA2.1 TaxID=3156376 RepID=UPI003394F7B4